MNGFVSKSVIRAVKGRYTKIFTKLLNNVHLIIINNKFLTIFALLN